MGNNFPLSVLACEFCFLEPSRACSLPFLLQLMMFFANVRPATNSGVAASRRQIRNSEEPLTSMTRYTLLEAITRILGHSIDSGTDINDLRMYLAFWLSLLCASDENIEKFIVTIKLQQVPF